MSFGQYVNLDFDQIKTSIRDYLRANTNFTDYDFEGSNLSIIIDALAYNTYITSYNTNMAANECFLDSSSHFEKTLLHLPETLDMFQDLVDPQEQNIFYFMMD